MTKGLLKNKRNQTKQTTPLLPQTQKVWHKFWVDPSPRHVPAAPTTFQDGTSRHRPHRQSTLWVLEGLPGKAVKKLSKLLLLGWVCQQDIQYSRHSTQPPSVSDHICHLDGGRAVKRGSVLPQTTSVKGGLLFLQLQCRPEGTELCMLEISNISRHQKA